MRAYDEVHAALSEPRPGADRALAALARLPRLRAELDVCEAALIEAARDDGAGWAAIASALGLASRQAGEQRLARLRRRVPSRQHNVDIAELARIVRDAHAAVAADPEWDGRWARAALVRQCLAIAAGLAASDPPGGLYSLVADVRADLADVADGLLPDAVARLKRPQG